MVASEHPLVAAEAAEGYFAELKCRSVTPERRSAALSTLVAALR